MLCPPHTGQHTHPCYRCGASGMVVAVFGVSYTVKDEAIYLADGEGRRDVRLRVLRLQKVAPPGSHRAILRWSGGGRRPSGGNPNKGVRRVIRLVREPSFPVLISKAARQTLS